MIKLQDFTPGVYYEQSRDFQLLGRLFDVVLNSVKTESELISAIPSSDNLPDSLLDLLSLTLGLQMHTTRYTSAHLRVVCAIFPKLLRTKGSIYSIQLLCNALLAAEGITDPASFTVKDYTIQINIPSTYTYTALLEDLLSYVLPAGFSFIITRNIDIQGSSNVTNLAFVQDVIYSEVEDTKSSLVNPLNLNSSILQNRLFNNESNKLAPVEGINAVSALQKAELATVNKSEDEQTNVENN